MQRLATSREVSEFRPIRGLEIILDTQIHTQIHRYTDTQTENRHTVRPCSTSSTCKKSVGLGKKWGKTKFWCKRMSCLKWSWPGQMVRLHRQTSLWQMLAFTDGPKNLPMNFGEDLICKSWDSGSQTLRWSGGRRPAGQSVLDRKYNHFVAPSCKLKLARFSA